MTDKVFVIDLIDDSEQEKTCGGREIDKSMASLREQEPIPRKNRSWKHTSLRNGEFSKQGNKNIPARIKKMIIHFSNFAQS